MNPHILGTDKDGATWDKATATDVLFIDYDNNQSIPQNCPFIVGEQVNICKVDGSDVAITQDGTDNFIITKIEQADDNYLKLTFTGNGPTNNSGSNIDFSTDAYVLYSDALKGASAGTSFNPKCTISNVEMIVHQITMSPEYERGMLSKVRESGGVVKFDYPSVAVQRHSTLSSETQPSVPLHLDYARAKGVICMPTDATLYNCQHQTSAKDTYMITKDNTDGKFIEDLELRSNRTGIEGCSNGLSEYSYFLNGKMVPSRPIKTKKVSNKRGGIDANYMVELEKALVSFGIEPNSFEYYNRNFLVGRMLAIGSNAVFDGRGRTARLDLKYEGTETGFDTPSVNLLWKIFVYHLRTLEIKANNVEVLM